MKKPNILLLMTDQMQGRVTFPNHPCKTPNLDSISKQGTLFKRAYTPNAVCSPARASLMTGLLPHNHGVTVVIHTVDDDQALLRTDKPHWAMKLEKEGYVNGYFGKWHVERSEQLDQFGWSWYKDKDKIALHKKKQEELLNLIVADKKKYHLKKNNEGPAGYNDTLLYAVTNQPIEHRPLGVTTSLALDFLDEVLSKDDPWCCFYSLTEPHDPFVCGKEAFDLYDVDKLELPPNTFDDLKDKPGLYRKAGRVWANLTTRERKEAMACYYASITEIDQQIGRLIAKLEDNDALEDTIIIFTSDHGEMLGARGLYTKNISALEEVYNIPLIMAGPGIPKGHISKARVGLHDLCPTILELTDCEPIQNPDSRSFAPIFSNPELEADYTDGFAEYHGGRILLTQRVAWRGPWKYIFNGFDIDELYHLEKDPYEMINIINNPENDKELRQISRFMWQRMKDTNDHSMVNSHYPIIRVAQYGPNI
jgi:arylsulfatase A-like enzyme